MLGGMRFSVVSLAKTELLRTRNLSNLTIPSWEEWNIGHFGSGWKGGTEEKQHLRFVCYRPLKGCVSFWVNDSMTREATTRWPWLEIWGRFDTAELDHIVKLMGLWMGGFKHFPKYGWIPHHSFNPRILQWTQINDQLVLCRWVVPVLEKFWFERDMYSEDSCNRTQTKTLTNEIATGFNNTLLGGTKVGYWETYNIQPLRTWIWQPGSIHYGAPMFLLSRQQLIWSRRVPQVDELAGDLGW